MSISINRTDGRIGIKTTPPKMEIATQKTKVDMEKKQAKVLIESEKPRVLIDQYPSRATAGMKNLTDLTKQQTERVKGAVLEFIGKVAGDGTDLAKVKKGGLSTIDIAQRDSKKSHEFGMVTMPSERPKIEVEGGVKIDWEPTARGAFNGVGYSVQPGKVDLRLNRGNVEIYLRQKPALEISYQPDKIIDEEV